MTNRNLRHTRGSTEFLAHNKNFIFGRLYALKFFRRNAIYTFIPKNACSTLRLTLAIDNRCIRDSSEHAWIHANNSTFCARLEDLIMADYTFVVLRDPFRRIASCFLDKVMRKHNPVKHMEEFLAGRNIQLGEICFKDFLEFLAIDNMVNADEHWRPQIDFLIYDDYDEYFCLEEFPTLTKVLQSKFDIEIADARPFLGKGEGQLVDIDSELDLSQTPMTEFVKLHAEGKRPGLRNLFSQDCLDLVRRIYHADIEEYEKRIGPTYAI